ncbi:hypothetical protein ACSEP3_06775 [Pseudomonas aeruginosa]
MNPDKIEKLMMLVLRGTSEGAVKWVSTKAPDSLTRATEDFISVYLEAEYKGRILAVYEVRSKYYRDEDEWSWTSGVKFAVVREGVVVYETSSYSPALRQLFAAARHNAADVDKMLEDLLDD